MLSQRNFFGVDDIVRVLILVGTVVLLFSSSARAITLDFNELDRATYAEYPDGVLTNEYQSVGLLFGDSAYLVENGEGNNAVGGPGFSILFDGELPNFVSMYVWSGSGHALFPRVYYASGEFEDTITKGQITGMFGDESREPYFLPQLISFNSSIGISGISLTSQTSTYMDDLTFTYGSVVDVAEPSSFLLFFLGLIGLTLYKRRVSEV